MKPKKSERDNKPLGGTHSPLLLLTIDRLRADDLIHSSPYKKSKER